MPLKLARSVLGAGLLTLVLAATGCDSTSSAAPTTVTTSTAPTTTEGSTDSSSGSLFGDHPTTPAAGLFGNASAVSDTGGTSGSSSNSGSSNSNQSTTGNSSSSSSSSNSSSGTVDPAKVRQLFGSDLIDVDLAIKLAGGCDDGDMQACDTLYLDAEQNSQAETFGARCGGRASSDATPCVKNQQSSTTYAHIPRSHAYPQTLPTDKVVADLVQACQAGSMNSCDALLFASAKGSGPYAYGQLCGGRSQKETLCVEQYGLGKDVLEHFLTTNHIPH